MEQRLLKDYTESGVEHGAKLGQALVDYQDLWTILKAIDTLRTPDFFSWLDAHSGELDSRTLVMDASDVKDLGTHTGAAPMLIFNKQALSGVRHLNTLLNTSNDLLPMGGYLWCHSRTSSLKHQIFLRAHPGAWGRFLYGLHYIWHRMFAKMYITRWLYMGVTKGKNRSYSRVEILGRMCRAGFEIVDERFSHGEFFVLGQKVKEPRRHQARTYGVLVKLPRIGYKGKLIGVYKLRSMYPYSEYLQPYMYKREGLEKGGKFAHDYRVNWWGKKFRGKWIDELPMFLNLLKGELKLVGVRPLSRQYYSMYTPEMQQMHISVKPGILPPFYYDEKSPETLEEVQESERRYIEAYRKHPIRTDWRYFNGILKNILIKKKRSQ